jgi:hypothetical protein
MSCDIKSIGIEVHKERNGILRQRVWHCSVGEME